MAVMCEQQIERVQGSVERVTFHSEESGFCVLRTKVKGHRDLVTVIGNAASAIQLIPELAESVAKLTVYHRSPNWIIFKGDRPYSRVEKWLGKTFPPLTNLYRFSIWAQGEFVIWPMIQGKKWAQKLGEWIGRRQIRKAVKDPELREILTPDFPIGAKRVLLSDKIYPALARENVEVVTSGVDHFTSDGIQTQDGIARAHDLVVMATGFYSNPFLKEITVTNAKGRTLRDQWANGAEAYLGAMTAGFPNLFMLYGPNTNTGHSSIIFKLEQQVGYIIQLIQKARATDKHLIIVDPNAEAEFNVEVQNRLRDLAWNKVEASWYLDGDKITNNWMGNTREFRARMKTPIWEHYQVS